MSSGRTTRVKVAFDEAVKIVNSLNVRGFWYLTFQFENEYYIVTSSEIGWEWYVKNGFKFELEI